MSHTVHTIRSKNGKPNSKTKYMRILYLKRRLCYVNIGGANNISIENDFKNTKYLYTS